jgi:hypothetical protein
MGNVHEVVKFLLFRKADPILKDHPGQGAFDLAYTKVRFTENDAYQEEEETRQHTIAKRTLQSVGSYGTRNIVVIVLEQSTDVEY